MRYLVLVLACLACGGPPKQVGDDEPKTPTAAATPATPATPAEPPAPQEPPRKHRPYEIYNACNDVVQISFGEDLKNRKTIAPGATIAGERNNDGNMALVLLGENDAKLVQVSITRGMKRVEVGKSCRTMDAR